VVISFDPRVSLATALAGQHGVYALLLGSGVSTGAGIPTSWGVVEALVRKAAVASHEEVNDDFDAAAWWAMNGDGQPLGYSSLLERLATTKAARRALLAEFFEPSDEDRELGLKVPGPAHFAIASLVRKGIVRVIITTNFDRLLERALEVEGISPQVIAGEGQVAGMEPPQHMQCTIIKLHGDFASLEQRNTIEELSSYPAPTEQLLRRVLDEYGLVVSGWSGEWDTALVAAIDGSANRRYPLYWTARSSLRDVAKVLTARSGAQVIAPTTADEFFPDMLARVEALESMSDSPESLNQAVARLKRLLPEPTRYIDLRDVFEDQLSHLRSYLKDRPAIPPSYDSEAVELAHLEIVSHFDTFLRLFATGIYLDRDEAHSDLWVHVLLQAIRSRSKKSGQVSEWWDGLQHLPALLLLTVGVAAAIGAGHETLVTRLLREPRWSDLARGEEPRPAFDVLHTYYVLNGEVINEFPSSGKTNWHYPQSHFLKSATLPLIEWLVGDLGEATMLFSRTEYRFALATQFFSEPGQYLSRAGAGEYLGDRHNSSKSSAARWAEDFVSNGSPSAWRLVNGIDEDEFVAQLAELTAVLERQTRFG
jgi:SIR2-like domain